MPVVCALMKEPPSPIFISLGSGNKVTYSDTDRWPLLASQMCIIRLVVSGLFYRELQHIASQSTLVGRNCCRGAGSGFNIHTKRHNLFRRENVPTILHHIKYVDSNALPLMCSQLGLWDLTVVPYQESPAIKLAHRKMLCFDPHPYTTPFLTAYISFFSFYVKYCRC